MPLLVRGPRVTLDTEIPIEMTKTGLRKNRLSTLKSQNEQHPMISSRLRLALLAPFILTVVVQSIGAINARDPADLPTPITSKESPADPFDGLESSPVKPKPYKWMVDDPLTPTSQSTISQFTTEVEDVDPMDILERPGIPVGWFAGLDLSVVNAHVSTRQDSGSLLSGTFADPISPPYSPFDWNVMPTLSVGYRQPEGWGELSINYRFLYTSGNGSVSPFTGAPTGNVDSRLQLHVLDFDYTQSDIFPTDLCFVPRLLRLTGGIRVAGVENKTSANGGNIANQSSSNTFVGAGPKFGIETQHDLFNRQWALFLKGEAAGVIGSDQESFSQTTTGPGGASAAASNSSIMAVPVLNFRTGFNWIPDWGCGSVKLSTGYQWERWYSVGTSANSFNELTLHGPFMRGELAF